MCQTNPHTRKHSHRPTQGHIQPHLLTHDTIPKGDVGWHTESLCDILSMNQVTVWLHLSQHRNSAALPPTRLLGEGLTADGWADTGGIWFTGRVSICGLRI